VFINLQKRLLSSIEAFARTLRLHAESVERGKAKTKIRPLRRIELEANEYAEDEYGEDDEQAEEAAGIEVSEASRLIETPEGRARALLDQMVGLAEQFRGAPDAKVLALLDWIRKTQCSAVRIGGAGGADTSWTDRRVIIFTEYGDTKRYLSRLLSTAIQGTDLADERIMQFHGGMSDEQREEVQRAFNSPPQDHPVRILLATDAAREGVNLQGHCADLFHYDVPWNPARMEQRNGRIDRTLQPSAEVRCHYFHYPQRSEDVVLEKLVEKVETIQRELGSLSAVLMDRMAQVMEPGIDDLTGEKLDRAEMLEGRRDVAAKELESQRDGRAELRAQLEEAGKILNKSEQVINFSPELLRDAIDVGLELSGAQPLKLLEPEKEAHRESAMLDRYELPELPASWQRTLDFLRPPKERDEAFWEWRQKPPQPVVFRPPKRMNSRLVHLHLEHPFVQRILSRFRSQGYSAHDLNRVTILKTPHDALVRVIAFGRLSLFGPGATRLHDQLVSVAARWVEGSSEPLRPFAEAADKKAVELLEQILKESPTEDQVPPVIKEKLRHAAPEVFSELWPYIRDEADTFAHDAGQKLAARAREESTALHHILSSHRKAIANELEESSQRFIEFTEREKAQRKQLEANRRYWEERLKSIEKDLENEPDQIANLYDVVLNRLEPVGLVFLWPEVRG
jgi:superfamily II DNA/RNA helicase